MENVCVWLIVGGLGILAAVLLVDCAGRVILLVVEHRRAAKKKKW